MRMPRWVNLGESITCVPLITYWNIFQIKTHRIFSCWTWTAFPNSWEAWTSWLKDSIPLRIPQTENAMILALPGSSGEFTFTSSGNIFDSYQSVLLLSDKFSTHSVHPCPCEDIFHIHSCYSSQSQQSLSDLGTCNKQIFFKKFSQIFLTHMGSVFISFRASLFLCFLKSDVSGQILRHMKMKCFTDE